MKRFLTRASVAGLSAALVAGAAFVAAPAASAAQIGNLAFTSGVNDGILNNQNDTFSFATDGACPTSPTLSTNFLIRVSGPGLPAAPNLVNIQGNTAASTVGSITTAAFSGPVQQTLSGFATAQAQAGGFLGAGTYTFELVCRTAFQAASLGEFVGQLTITGSGASSVVSQVLPSVSTSTVLSGPTTGNTTSTATFTAAVSPTNAVGAVQFRRGGVAIGSPVAAVAGSATSPTVGPLSAGSYAITADFVGGSSPSASFGNSSSNTVTYVVSQATGSTTTNIALSSASVAYPATVTATATVSGPVTIGSGTVQFQVDGANVGSPVPVNASGVAVSAPIARNAGGPYAVIAVFSGTTVAGVQYGTSTSPAASFNVSAAQFTPDEQFIKTTIPAGTLVISTPYSCATLACDLTTDNPLNLGNMVLNATATEYSAFGAFTGIQVTDTRPGNLPWTVSAISSNLAKVGVAVPNNNEIINAQNVGLTNLTLVSTNSTPATFLGGVLPGGSTAAQNFTGFQNFAAAHVDGANVGTLGLGGSPKVVLHANSGLGTTVTNGVLTITAPTNTLDGVYTGTVTFTIIGS